MIAEENLETILSGLFPDIPIAHFSIDWILNSPRATEKSIREVYEFLRRKGLKDDKIATHAPLLGRDPETIERNYQHHVGLLRQDYRDRNSGRYLLVTYANLLGIPPNTIESNVQFLHGIGVDYNNGILLGTTPQTKRKKMAWMLRELFDYRGLSQEQKKRAIDGMYSFVRDNPIVLAKSINSMERIKDKLRERVAPYKR